MPADPLLNEAYILNLLQDVETPKTPDDYRLLVSLVLMSAFDRKVTHEYFRDLLNLGTGLQQTLADMEGTAQMVRLLQKFPEANERAEPMPNLEQAMDKIMEHFRGLRTTLTEKMKEIMQCPGAGVKLS